MRFHHEVLQEEEYTMFQKLLIAGALATGIGLTGTASEAAAGDRHRSHHFHHDHHDHFRGHRGHVHIQPYPYYGGSRFGYGNSFYGRPGRFYGGPGFRQPFYGNRSGLHIGGRNFSFSIIR